MATIDQLITDGGAGLSRESGLDTVKDLFDAAADDLENFQTKFNALLAQLDTEGGLGGGYVTAHQISSLNLQKG